jgi:hypothetical protein
MSADRDALLWDIYRSRFNEMLEQRSPETEGAALAAYPSSRRMVPSLHPGRARGRVHHAVLREISTDAAGGRLNVGAIQNAEGRITAVQRIYIDPVTAKKVSAKPAKKTKGPMQDGAVRLAKPARILGIAEGIETAMSAMHMFSLPVWACLGAQRLRAVWIPEEVEQLVLFADRGEVGMREAIDAAEVYEAKGLSTEIVLPDEPHKDFNDWHQARAGGRRA